MLSAILGSWGTILVALIVAATCTLIIVKLIKDKKKGKTSCGCDCGQCPSHNMCHKH